MDVDNEKAIAKLNDKLRKARVGFYSTAAVAHDELFAHRAAREVSLFDAFDEGNDPYGEHDFGSFELQGTKLMWKIDYYDQSMREWCDPLSPACHRVLTIMFAEEY